MSFQKWYADADDNATSLYRHLDTNGDGTGTKNANVNGSITPQTFYIQPPANEVYVLWRMLVEITDTNGITGGEYGKLPGLSNGIDIVITDSSDVDIIHPDDEVNVTTNADWGRLCYDVSLIDWGAGDDTVLVRWTFNNSGRPVILKDQQKFKVIINDDLTGLIAHYFFVQGYKAQGKPSNG